MRSFILLACSIASLPMAAAADIPFTLDPVGAEAPHTYTDLSLELDANEEPRLSFDALDGVNEALFYAEKSGETWAVEVVDHLPFAYVSNNSLALDSYGEPHISYLKEMKLHYASRSGGTWITEIVDPNPYEYTGIGTSIAVDSNDKPHISYFVNTLDEYGNPLFGNLKYATKVAGQWIMEAPGGWDVAGGPPYTSLALDASGNPCISYTDLINSRLKLARKADGVWTSQVVSPIEESVDRFSSLTIDANGVLHIAYRTMLPSQLKYTTKSGAAWITETVDDIAGWQTPVSIDADAQGNPWISYSDPVNAKLKLATKQSGVWTTQIIDSNSSFGTSIVVDSHNFPWIAYHSPAAADLRVAIPNLAAVGVEPFAANDSFVGAPFPNPSRGAVSFAIRLPTTDSVRLTLFDVGGRMISRIPGQELQVGSRVVTWNPRDVESGVYFLRVESNSGIQETRQITVIR